MYKEMTGKMDIHVSHDLTMRQSMRKDDWKWNHINDLYSSSKIEVRGNNFRGVR